MDLFQAACGRAIEKAGVSVWNALTAREQSMLIYQELHALDAELAAGTMAPAEGEQTSGQDDPDQR
jgi:hypothetical protein